eukprot:TRINITY_DN49030_c0_g1_i1.p1 TRINITY_DN49030_c0_g1~~TRINITY_DN49030_c0_g1_i1.p1  ORF type:complete len:322 (+),score=49.89 TRINITY_DN49030_c0_g1_i1:152-1117(+)
MPRPDQGPKPSKAVSCRPPAVLKGKDGEFALFTTSSVAQREAVLECRAMVFHEIPSGHKCEGCQARPTMKCPGCSLRFCSKQRCDFLTRAWHGAACGSPPADQALKFCEGQAKINGVDSVFAPWRAGMGAFKILLSLALAARQGAGHFQSLKAKYSQIKVSYSREEQKMRAAAFKKMGAPLWSCWQKFLDREESGSRMLLEESCDLQNFLDIIVMYNDKNHQAGLYFEQTFCSHSCRPNVAAKSVEDGRPLQVFALRRLAAGEQITMTSVNPQMSRPQRRQQLRQMYGIDCKCVRCTADSDVIPKEEMDLLMGGGEECCIM